MKKKQSKFQPILNKFEKFILIIIASLYSASPAFAQTLSWGGVCTKEGVATIQGLECLIANVFNVIISLIGLAAFAMFIFGSMQWMLSGGNTEGTKKARDTMTYAVIGIVIALSAFIVLNLIAGFTGVKDITKFMIPTS